MKANMVYYQIHLFQSNTFVCHWVIIQTLQNGQTLGQFFEPLYVVTNRWAGSPEPQHFSIWELGCQKKKSRASELNSKYIASHVTQRNDLWLIVFTAVTCNNLWTLGWNGTVLDALETAFRAVGGGINLPPIGQYGEDSIHWFNGSVATNPIFSG